MSPETEWVIRKSYYRRHGVPAAFWALLLILGIGSICVVGICARDIQHQIDIINADLNHIAQSLSRSHR